MIPDGYVLTKHARDVLEEREIPEEWVAAALTSSDKMDWKNAEEVHFSKRIDAFGGRWLRVITNPSSDPKRIVTVFFDRKLRRDHETQGR